MLIAIEGLDGAGKSTQIDLLIAHLQAKNIKTEFVHFPRMVEGSVFGDLISRFLRGEFGKIEDVHPQLVALLFAEDRRDFSTVIKKWLAEDCFVILDRYVLSNIAFQCAKLQSFEAKKELTDWIFEFEFEYNKIPKPDFSIFLDVPFSFTQKSLTKVRKGDARAYLQGKTDIHENNLHFQQAVKAGIRKAVAK